MTWSAPSLCTPGQLITAAFANSNWRDNQDEMFAAKATAEGDIAYATGANVIAVLPIGDEGDVLGVASGIPAWVPPPSSGASAADYDSGSGTRASETPGDLSGADVGPEITLAVGASGIAVIAIAARIVSSSTAGVAAVQFKVDGAGLEGNLHSGLTTGIRVGETVVVSGLSEGNHTFTVVYSATGGVTGTFSQRRIFGFAP